MAKFGFEGIGANTRNVQASIYGCKYACGEEGIAQSITIYLSPNGIGRNFKVALYRDSDKALIAQGLLASPPNVLDWYEVTLSTNPALVAADYWLVVKGDAGGDVYFADDIGWDYVIKANVDLLYADFPEDPLDGTFNLDRKFSFYCTYEVNQAPTAPTVLEVDGKSSPTGANCVTATPQFTAIFNDPDAGDISNAIEIQVGSASGLSDMWDSGWVADSTVDGNRCGAKTYAGVALSTGTSYWWRCRFRDDGGGEGTWSVWQQFYVCTGDEVGLLECAPGGPLPKRCPFRCAVALPRRVPSWAY